MISKLSNSQPLGLEHKTAVSFRGSAEPVRKEELPKDKFEPTAKKDEIPDAKAANDEKPVAEEITDEAKSNAVKSEATDEFKPVNDEPLKPANEEPEVAIKDEAETTKAETPTVPEKKGFWDSLKKVVGKAVDGLEKAANTASTVANAASSITDSVKTTAGTFKTAKK